MIRSTNNPYGYSLNTVFVIHPGNYEREANHAQTSEAVGVHGELIVKPQREADRAVLRKYYPTAQLR